MAGEDNSYDGKEGTVEHIDGIGQLHGTWGGVAIIPGVDDFEIINEGLRIYPDSSVLNNQLLFCLEDDEKEQYYKELDEKGILQVSSIMKMTMNWPSLNCLKTVAGSMSADMTFIVKRLM